MPKDFTAELVVCLGQPVRENPTGVMQEAAFLALGLEWRYLTVEVPPSGLRDAMVGVRALGMRSVADPAPGERRRRRTWLWLTGEVYDPLYNRRSAQTAPAVA